MVLLDRLIRKGKTFDKISRELKETEFYSAEKLEEYQNLHLRKMISHCYRHVPYYRGVFDELKLKPEDIQTREDLKKLPYMDKRLLQDHFEQLKSRRIPGFLYTTGRTSGTSGFPVSTLRDFYSINFENAALWRFWGNAGDHGLKRITLRGENVVPISRTEPPYWRYSADRTELVMSSYHLNPDSAVTYFQKIEEHAPEVIYAYPSAVYLLARLCRMLKRKLSVRFVFTSSEILTEHVRKYVEDTFGCRVFDWYGQSERVAAAGMCEKGTYHILEDYSITELVDFGNGTEIVGTTLHNYAMPLLRYRTEDVVIPEAASCTCGRGFREISGIMGRKHGYVQLADGARIPSILLEYSIDLSTNVIEAQLVQKKAGEIIINVCGNKKFGDTDRRRLIVTAKEHTADDITVILNEMDQIPRGPNGKFQHFVSHLNLLDFDTEPEVRSDEQE